MKIKKITACMLLAALVIFLNNIPAVYAADIRVTLMLTASDPGCGSGVTQMMISNSGDFQADDSNKGNTDDGVYIPYTVVSGESYAEVQNWKLAAGNWISDGNWDTSSSVRTVYVKFKDASGNESITSSQQIDISGSNVLDYAQINGGSFYTNSKNININLKGSSTYSNLQISNDGGVSWPTSSAYNSSDWQLPCTLPAGDGTKNLLIKASNGGMATIKALSIALDETPPVIGNVTVSPQITASHVTVTADFSDDTSGIFKKLYASGQRNVNYFKNAGAAVQAINGNSFSLNTNGTYTIYAEDSAGNGTVQTVGISNIDNAAPAFDSGTGASLDDSGKVFTFTFSKNVVNALSDNEALKSSISLAADGTNYASLCAGDTVQISSGKLVITFSNALRGTANKIKIAANALEDNLGNVKSDVTVTDAIDAVRLPGAPTNVSASAGDGQATVSFTAPSDDGGSTVAGYTVSANPSGITASGITSPIVVRGLVNGTAYTFTVKAQNSKGDGAESSSSISVTPIASNSYDDDNDSSDDGGDTSSQGQTTGQAAGQTGQSTQPAGNESDTDKVPYGSVLIGDMAYNLDYANKSDNEEEVRNAVVNNIGKDIYVKGFDGIWIDNLTSKSADKSIITVKSYKDIDGKVTEYK